MWELLSPAITVLTQVLVVVYATAWPPKAFELVASGYAFVPNPLPASTFTHF